MTELKLVLARYQNLFFVDLAEAIVHELNSLGVTSSITYEPLPRPRRGLVTVLVPPHEYFTLNPSASQLAAPDALKRTVFLSAEQPGTWFFDRNVELTPSAGAVLDINPSAVKEYHRRGVSALHFQLGYSDFFDRHRPSKPRDIDVLFLGSESERRTALLGQLAPTLAHTKHCLVFSDNTRPNYAESESFRRGSSKYELLTSAQTLINIHASNTRYFEWLRIVEAICNGCVVVSEHSVDFDPLIPGDHFISGRPETLGDLALGLLSDPELLATVRSQAYDLLREELPLRAAASLLAEIACEIDSHPTGASGHGHWDAPASSYGGDPPLFRRQPQGVTEDTDASSTRAALKELSLQVMTLQRSVTRLEHAFSEGQPPARITIDRRTPAYSARDVDVSVLLSVFNYAHCVADALESLDRCYFSGFEVIIVDDGSRDLSLPVIREWLASHPRLQAILLRHPVNRGLGEARNAALAFSRGEFVFVLDADNEIYPHCFSTLTSLLREDPSAAFAYGILEKFRHDGPVGLMNCLPWDPERFRGGNYIDAMALVRTKILRALGGYTTDSRLHGWEDFDLWCRIADRGWYARFAPEIVARYRAEGHSMLSLTNLSTSIAFSMLATRAPSVMGGIRLPL